MIPKQAETELNNLGRPEPETLETRVRLSLNQDTKFHAQDLAGPLATMPESWAWKGERRSLEGDVGRILDRFRNGEYDFREAHTRICRIVVEARLKPAAELLHEALWRRLTKSPAACAFRRLLLGSEVSTAEDARREGFSDEAVRKQEIALSRTFRLPRP